MNELQFKDYLIEITPTYALGTICAELVHDLNNPLAILSMSLENILDYCEKEELKPMKTSVERAVRATDKITGIIQSITEYRQVQNTSTQMFDIKDAIDSILSLFTKHFSNKGIEINKTFSPEKLLINGNKKDLQNAFLHLIFNIKDELTKKPIEQKQITININQNNKNIFLSAFYNNIDTEAENSIGILLARHLLGTMDWNISVNTGISDGTLITIQIPMPPENE